MSTFGTRAVCAGCGEPLGLMPHLQCATEQPWAASLAGLSEGPDPMSVPQAVHLILDVLRANNLHQTHCQWRVAEASETVVFHPRDVPLPLCNCWLATPGDAHS